MGSKAKVQPSGASDAEAADVVSRVEFSSMGRKVDDLMQRMEALIGSIQLQAKGAEASRSSKPRDDAGAPPTGAPPSDELRAVVQQALARAEGQQGGKDAYTAFLTKAPFVDLRMAVPPGLPADCKPTIFEVPAAMYSGKPPHSGLIRALANRTYSAGFFALRDLAVAEAAMASSAAPAAEEVVEFLLAALRAAGEAATDGFYLIRDTVSDDPEDVVRGKFRQAVGAAKSFNGVTTESRATEDWLDKARQKVVEKVMKEATKTLAGERAPRAAAGAEPKAAWKKGGKGGDHPRADEKKGKPAPASAASGPVKQ